MTTTQGVKENPYILYSSSYLWPSGTTELTYSFNDYIFSSSDAARQAKFHLTLSENYRNLVREAMDAWERVSGVRFREVADDPDNDIRIGWSAESDGLYGTLGVATTWTSTGSFGRTLKVALHFDLADRHDRTQFYDTALHEIGHAIGIDHSNVTGVVMSGTPNSRITTSRAAMFCSQTTSPLPRRCGASRHRDRAGPSPEPSTPRRLPEAMATTRSGAISATT